MQGHDINAQQAMSAALMTKMFFQSQCSDSAFTVFYDTVVKEAQQFTNEPVLPRRRRVPARYDDGSLQHYFASTTDFFHQQYFFIC